MDSVRHILIPWIRNVHFCVVRNYVVVYFAASLTEIYSVNAMQCFLFMLLFTFLLTLDTCNSTVTVQH